MRGTHCYDQQFILFDYATISVQAWNFVTNTTCMFQTPKVSSNGTSSSAHLYPPIIILKPMTGSKKA